MTTEIIKDLGLLKIIRGYTAMKDGEFGEISASHEEIWDNNPQAIIVEGYLILVPDGYILKEDLGIYENIEMAISFAREDNLHKFR